MGLIENHPHQWPQPLQALEHKEFRSLWLALFLSNSGSWMQRAASAWLIYELSDSITWLGIDAAASGIIAIIALPIGGVLADRIDRRRFLLMMNLANAMLALLLAILTWRQLSTIWHALTISTLNAFFSSLGAPASQAIVPRAAGIDHLSNAIALNSFQYNVARAFGPALAGLVLAGWGAGACFAINACTYLIMAGALLVLKAISESPNAQSSGNASSSEGLRFLITRCDLVLLLALVSVIAFGGAPLVTLLPAVSKEQFNGASHYSFLLTSFGIGAAFAGVALAYAQPKSLNPLWFVVSSAALCLVECLLPWSTSFVLSAFVVAVSGATFVGNMIGLGSELLSRTPDELRGRISALQQMSFRVAQPLGGLIAAILADNSGLKFTFSAFGIVLLAGSLCCLGLRSQEQAINGQ